MALANDPARFKSAFTGAGGVDPGYAARTMAFNRGLYQPADTRAQTAQMPMIAPLSTARRTQNPAGYQQAGRSDLVRIASQYRGTPSGMPADYADPRRVAGSSDFRTVSANPDIQPLNPNMPTLAGEPVPTGSAGPVGAQSPSLTSAEQAENPNLGPGGMDEIGAMTAPALLTGNSRPNDPTHPQLDDTSHARGVIDEFQSILDDVNGGSDADQPTSSAPPASYPTSPTSDRPNGWWNTPFNKTGTAAWGTGLDERPESSGPAPSSQRFYQRALDRAQGGSKSDINRINRLDRRINGR